MNIGLTANLRNVDLNSVLNTYEITTESMSIVFIVFGLVSILITALMIFVCYKMAIAKGLPGTYALLGLLGVIGIVIIAVLPENNNNKNGYNNNYPNNNQQGYNNQNQFYGNNQTYNLNGQEYGYGEQNNFTSNGKICLGCGHAVSGNDSFCPKCGTKV